MFRRVLCLHHGRVCFPRIRGDVPPTASSREWRCQFSPHTRGCSLFVSQLYNGMMVFPAYAGMFRVRRRTRHLGGGFPRIRGDVPLRCCPDPTDEAFSPHTRGCSAPVASADCLVRVFPAYAGMFRQRWPYHVSSASFPRIRGDVPAQVATRSSRPPFSPHTRGCSVFLPEWDESPEVFPAYAGMFRRKYATSRENDGFPRIRGDVPVQIMGNTGETPFSPHTRGCSGIQGAYCLIVMVFPAYAGMFPLRWRGWMPASGFPRIRGDVPTPMAWSPTALTFSPHTRGCSDDPCLSARQLKVFPAYAGMFLKNLSVKVITTGFPRIRGDVPKIGMLF